MEDLPDVSLLSECNSSFNTNDNLYDSTFNDLNIDVQIQTERLIAILTELIYKTEIAVFILHLNDERIKSLITVLSNDDMERIMEFHSNSCIINFEKDEMYNLITNEQIQKVMTNPGEKIYPELSQIIWIIYKNIKSKEIINENINMNDDNSLEVIHYLDALIKFKNKMADKLTITADEKLKKDLISKNFNRMNKTLKTQIDEITEKLKQDKESFEKIFNEKENMIKIQQAELDSLRKDNDNMIMQKLLETEYKINEATEAHITKYEILQEKDEECKKHYESLLRVNLDSENKFRAERIDAENKLTVLLQEYDEVVGGKQSNLDDLTIEYEAEKEQFMTLQKKFDEQEEEYIPLMAEKEAEYQREILTKMTTFLMEHAARVIQRAWRRILASRAEKKKGKRATSKKKKAKDGTKSKKKNIKRKAKPI